MTICIIPARGGSKGIKKKNIRTIRGKPLIVHSIIAAKNSQTIDKVYVSTDDKEIAKLSEKHGALIIPRPKNISGDKAPSELALLHGLDFIEKTEKIKPDILVFIQCTSPLTMPKDIDNIVNILIHEKADSALSVCDFHYFLWKRNSYGNSEGINHSKKKRDLRQYKEKQYLENGAIYAMKTVGFKKYKQRFFGKTIMYEMPNERSLEVDEEVDLHLAETLFRYNDVENRKNLLPQKITGIVFDFDGVFTDNKVTVSEDGSESVTCDRGDGMGIELLQKFNIPLLVISTEKNKVVVERCKKLNLDVQHGVKNKLKNLKEWVKRNKINRNGLVYMGNDINDIECLQFSTCGVCVANAHPKAKMCSDIILYKNGGNGAIRELCDLIIDTFKNEKPSS